jgi:ribonuclease P protein component
MDSVRQTFKKGERLCSKKSIAELFEKGNSFYSFPFQVIWHVSSAETKFPAQVAISVSKKLFRRAVQRNLIKRRIRESYRKNKQILYDFLVKKESGLNLIIIFKGDTIPDYPETERSLKTALDKLINELNKKWPDYR